MLPKRFFRVVSAKGWLLIAAAAAAAVAASASAAAATEPFGAHPFYCISHLFYC